VCDREREREIEATKFKNNFVSQNFPKSKTYCYGPPTPTNQQSTIVRLHPVARQDKNKNKMRLSKTAMMTMVAACTSIPTAYCTDHKTIVSGSEGSKNVQNIRNTHLRGLLNEVLTPSSTNITDLEEDQQVDEQETHIFNKSSDDQKSVSNDTEFASEDRVSRSDDSEGVDVNAGDRSGVVTPTKRSCVHSKCCSCRNEVSDANAFRNQLSPTPTHMRNVCSQCELHQVNRLRVTKILSLNASPRWKTSTRGSRTN
jgi:hypothetical protein